MRIQTYGPTLVVHAPAKLNLGLKVLGRRADGFHELETVFVSISLYDRLEFLPNAEGTVELTCRWHGKSGLNVSLPADSGNLVVRAAELLRQSTATTRGTTILLEKGIPVEAGLGGGSSDAAATLIALNRLWGLGLSTDDLHELAAELGSDVNFFLDSLPAAVGRGRGERLGRVHLPMPMHFVVVKPPFGLSTREVFGRLFAGMSIDPPVHWKDLVSPMTTFRELKRLVHNDLERPACELNPEIGRPLDQLRREDVVAAGMTGSGSACFALCRSARHARTVAARLRGLNLGVTYCVRSPG